MSLRRPGAVLLVEDDLDIRDSLADVLEFEGYRVHRAEHGARALDMLRAGLSPDVILLDLMMPVMDGFRLRELLLEDDGLSRIPLIIMSADGHIDQKMARIGARHYLRKPVDIDDLIASLRSVLAQTPTPG